MEQQQRDFGLEEFITKYRLNIAETSFGKLRKLTLTPTEQTEHGIMHVGSHSGTFYKVANVWYENPSIDVILSGGQVLGATLRGMPEQAPHQISTAGEQIFGYHLTPEHIYVGVPGNLKERLLFDQFLSIGENPHNFVNRRSMKEGEVHAMYSIHRNGEASLSFFSFWQRNVARFSPYLGFEEGWLSISSDDTHYISQKSTSDGSTIGVRFLKTIATAQIREIETLAKSETGWLKLPARVPILAYSESMPMDKAMKA